MNNDSAERRRAGAAAIKQNRFNSGEKHHLPAAHPRNTRFHTFHEETHEMHLTTISMKDLKRIKSRYYVVGQPIPKDFAYLFCD